MKRAFSLAEVLTVVMIILIVMAATYPVLFQARAFAKQTVCESNLHQIYLGIEIYDQDWGDLPSISPYNPAWYKPYSGGVRFYCPSAPDRKPRVDYVITAGAFSDLPPSSDLYKKWHECRDKRGTDYPFAYDLNHHGTVDGYQAAGQRVILVRASGQVSNVPYRQPGDWYPCDPELGPEIQH